MLYWNVSELIICEQSWIIQLCKWWGLHWCIYVFHCLYCTSLVLTVLWWLVFCLYGSWTARSLGAGLPLWHCVVSAAGGWHRCPFPPAWVQAGGPRWPGSPLPPSCPRGLRWCPWFWDCCVAHTAQGRPSGVGVLVPRPGAVRWWHPDLPALSSDLGPHPAMTQLDRQGLCWLPAWGLSVWQPPGYHWVLLQRPAWTWCPHLGQCSVTHAWWSFPLPCWIKSSDLVPLWLLFIEISKLYCHCSNKSIFLVNWPEIHHQIISNRVSVYSHASCTIISP